MSKLPWINYKNTNSRNFGLMVQNKNTYNAPARDVTSVTVPGRSGNLIIDNGRYNNINISYDLAILLAEHINFTDNAQAVRNWLCTEYGYFPLTDSYDPLYFRLAAFAAELNIEQELRDLGKTSVTFDCKPFKYSFEGQQRHILTAANRFFNAEKYPSKPYIKINGNGILTLYINNDSFNFVGVSEYIEIDSEAMTVYKNSQNQAYKLNTPKLPTLNTGDNNISWSGNVTSVEIIPRWCTI